MDRWSWVTISDEEGRGLGGEVECDQEGGVGGRRGGDIGAYAQRGRIYICISGRFRVGSEEIRSGRSIGDCWAAVPLFILLLLPSETRHNVTSIMCQATAVAPICAHLFLST